MPGIGQGGIGQGGVGLGQQQVIQQNPVAVAGPGVPTSAMQFLDIFGRVRSKLDDRDGTYAEDDYLLGFVSDVQDWLYGKLRLTGHDFDEQIVVLPAVAPQPDLNAYMAAGKPLATLVQPTMIRWKLPGQDSTFWRRAEGPLDYVREQPPGVPQLDSWAYIRGSIKLSNYSTPLDIEVTGDFLFDPVNSPDNQIEITQAANRVFSCKLASEVGKARGNKEWVVNYGADADEALDDLKLALVRADQAKTHRIARMSRSAGSSVRVSTNR